MVPNIFIQIDGCMAALDLIDNAINALFSYLPRKKPLLSANKPVRLIAHRGAHDRLQCIENTHAAFERALKLGCFGIEFDIHATADDVLVVNHDPDLQRLWGINKRIADMSFQELQQQVPDVPSLKDIVERYGKHMHLFIELKEPFDSEIALANTLQSLDAGVDYHLLGLDNALLASLTLFAPETRLLVAGHNNTASFCQLALNQQYGGVLGHYLLLTNHKINQLWQANCHVGVGFIDSKFSLYREISRGITWLFTNNAQETKYWLDSL